MTREAATKLVEALRRYIIAIAYDVAGRRAGEDEQATNVERERLIAALMDMPDSSPGSGVFHMFE